jgi:hypothetical protein
MTVHVYDATRLTTRRLSVELRYLGTEDVDGPAYGCAVALDSDNSHSLHDQYAYLDVGRWGGQERKFGIIYGYGDSCYVAACEYVPQGQSYTPAMLPAPAVANSAVSHPVVQFLRHCRSSVVHGRTFSGVDTQEKFYLILGDLHLPVVSHLNGPDPSQRPLPEILCRVDAAYMESIIPELNDFASLQGVTTSGVTSVSPGIDRMMIDSPIRWYERYLASDIFTDPQSNVVANDLRTFMELAQSWSYTGIQVHLIQVGDMYEVWVGLKRLFEETPPNRREVNICAPTQETCYFYNPSSLSQRGCDLCREISSTDRRYRDMVRRWLDMVNETTQAGSESLAQWLHHQTTFPHKTWLYGNHDSYLRNARLCEEVGIPARSLNFVEHQIQFEHGHEGDVYNRDGAASGHAITQGAAFVWNLRPILSSWVLEVFGVPQQQRNNFVRYAANKFLRDENPIKIFVMAHTHAAHLGVVKLAAGVSENEESGPHAVIYAR